MITPNDKSFYILQNTISVNDYNAECNFAIVFFNRKWLEEIYRKKRIAFFNMREEYKDIANFTFETNIDSIIYLDEKYDEQLEISYETYENITGVDLPMPLEEFKSTYDDYRIEGEYMVLDQYGISFFCEPNYGNGMRLRLSQISWRQLEAIHKLTIPNSVRFIEE